LIEALRVEPKPKPFNPVRDEFVFSSGRHSALASSMRSGEDAMKFYQMQM
jgi:hypothetical protein